MAATGRSASLLDTRASGGGAFCAAPARGVPSAGAAASPPPAGVPDVRATAEYGAAWDLELWKAVQADRFRAQLERERGAAMAELARVVRRREREAAAAVAVRTESVAAREAAVCAAEAQLAGRQQRVAAAERDVRDMRQQLLAAQARVEDEVRAQVRLANDTIAHRARLLEERVRAAEAQTQRAEERQRQAQQEYLTLYEAFSRHRTQQLGAAAAGAASSGAVTVSSTAAAPLLPPAVQLEQLRAQWDAAHQLQLDRQAQRHATEVSAVEARCRELAGENRRLTAALARRREQLRLVRGGAGAPTAAASAGAAAPTLPSRPPPPAAAVELSERAASVDCDGAVREQAAAIVRELLRLETDRVALVDGSSGALRATDAVILRMDARVRDLQVQLAAVQGGGGCGAAKGAVVPAAGPGAA